MFEFRKPIAAALAVAVCTSFAATAMAAPLTYVAPKGAFMKFSNATCPGTAEIKIVVWSKESGPVKVALEMKGIGTVSTGVIDVSTSAHGGYKGIKTGTVGLVSAPSKMKYRLVATGNGKTRKSEWVKAKSCALSL